MGKPFCVAVEDLLPSCSDRHRLFELRQATASLRRLTDVSAGYPAHAEGQCRSEAGCDHYRKVDTITDVEAHNQSEHCQCTVEAIDYDQKEEIFEELGSYDWIVFSSANGVRCFFDLLIEKYEDLRAFGNLRIAAVGEATARAVRAYHLRVDIVPARATAEDLAEALVAAGDLEHAKVVVVTAVTCWIRI